MMKKFKLHEIYRNTLSCKEYICERVMILGSTSEMTALTNISDFTDIIYVYQTSLCVGLDVWVLANQDDSQLPLPSLPIGFTQSPYVREKSPGINPTKFGTECQHTWKNYTGLNETFTYCTKCDGRKQ